MKILKRINPLLIVGILAIIYGGVTGFVNNSGEFAGFFSTLLLAFLLFGDAVAIQRKELPNSCTAKNKYCYSWIILIGSLLLYFGLSHWNIENAQLVLFFGIGLSIVTRYSSFIVSRQMTLVLIAALFLLPLRSQIILLMSYPLRVMATVGSAGIMRLFDSGIVYSQTTIKIGQVAIGITDACSGIAQFEAMLLLAYIIIRRKQLFFVWKTLYYIFLFPAIIIANSLRLIITILLFYLLGERALANDIHQMLGFIQVILTMSIFLFAGVALPINDERKL